MAGAEDDTMWEMPKEEEGPRLPEELAIINLMPVMIIILLLVYIINVTFLSCRPCTDIVQNCQSVLQCT